MTSISASIQLQPLAGVSCSGGGRIPLTKDECHESGTPLLIEKVKKLLEEDVGKEVYVDDEITQINKDSEDYGPGYIKGCYVYEMPGGYSVNYNTGNGAIPATMDQSQQAICKERVTG